MKLGTKITAFFSVAMILGIISLLGGVITLVADDSPYRFGRLAGLWFLIQLGGAVVLLYSGIFGLVTCNVTEITATRYNMKVAWSAFVFIAVMYLSCIWFVLADSQRHHSATIGDWVAVGIGMITIVVATFYYVQACRYFLRLHRLRRPYEELQG